MDNLGFQGIFGLLSSDPRVRCERAFLEETTGPSPKRPRASLSRGVLSLESGLPIKSFDVIAFSISFENDYLNVLGILKESGIEPFAAGRGDKLPLLLAGGVGIFINPEPMSPFMDAIFLGEADEAMKEMVEVLLRAKTERKQAVIESLSEIEGVYVPSIHSPFLCQEGGAPPAKTVRRRHVSRLSSTFRSSVITSSRSHLGGMVLVESGRGCSRKCRFCAVTSVYSPLRFVDADSLLSRIEESAPSRGAVGIVGACVSEHPKLIEIVTSLAAKNIRVSLSSVRADSASAELLRRIALSGTRTITLAPEAGTVRLRKLINKELQESKLIEVAETVFEGGISSLKLYFMIGLPEERPEDVEAIVSLVGKIHSGFISGRGDRRLVVSVSPFVPKAFTPFQWFGVNERRVLDKKMQMLAKGFSRMKGVRFTGQSVRTSILEAAISRGDWRAGKALYSMVYHGETLKKAWTEAGLDFEVEVFQKRDAGPPLPWDHLKIGPARKELELELKRALSGE